MKIEIFTICDNAQAYGDKLIVVGPFTIIAGPELPISRPPFSIAVRLRYTPDECGLKEYYIGIRKPDGTDVFKPMKFQFDADFKDSPLGVLNLNVNLPSVKFDQEGEYTVYLEGSGIALTQTFYVNLE